MREAGRVKRLRLECLLNNLKTSQEREAKGSQHEPNPGPIGPALGEESEMARKKVTVPASRAAAKARGGGMPARPMPGGKVRVPASRAAARARRGK